MSTTTTPTAGAVRTFVARHPVATITGWMLAVGFGLLIPPAVAGWMLEPFLLVATLLGQLGGAVLVTAACDGRAGVRELFQRVFRWRVHPVWYAVAFLVLPVAALLGTAAAWGTTAGLVALATDPAVILAYLSQLAILPLINLWEETAVMGVIQARLATTRGPLVGALITGLIFALYHLPLRIGQPIEAIALGLVLTAVAGTIPLRIVAGWLYNRTGGSILLVAALHATFNAVNNNNLLSVVAPGSTLLAQTAFFVIEAWAVILLVATRGRLGAARTPVSPDRAATVDGTASRDS